jgi:hypothetical protein
MSDKEYEEYPSEDDQDEHSTVPSYSVITNAIVTVDGEPYQLKRDEGLILSDCPMNGKLVDLTPSGLVMRSDKHSDVFRKDLDLRSFVGRPNSPETRESLTGELSKSLESTLTYVISCDSEVNEADRTTTLDFHIAPTVKREAAYSPREFIKDFKNNKFPKEINVSNGRLGYLVYQAAQKAVDGLGIIISEKENGFEALIKSGKFIREWYSRSRNSIGTPEYWQAVCSMEHPIAKENPETVSKGCSWIVNELTSHYLSSFKQWPKVSIEQSAYFIKITID